jgi:hypothetical protein
MLFLPRTFLLGLATTFLCFAKLQAQEPWRKEALFFRLDTQQIRALQTKGFATEETSLELDQIQGFFRFPFFTADSLLRIYHKLFEMGMNRKEFLRRKQLTRTLQCLWEALCKENHGDGIPGFLIAGALGLLTSKLPKAVPLPLKTELMHQFDLIKKARGRTFPSLWGQPDERFPAIALEGFKPHSFYTKTEDLKRLFWSTRWLIGLPLRLDIPSEREALLQIRKAFLCLKKEDRKGLGFPPEIKGPPMDWDLRRLSKIPEKSWKRKWERRRRMFRRKGILLREKPFMRLLSLPRSSDQTFFDQALRKVLQRNNRSPHPILPRSTWLLPPLSASKLGHEDGSLHEQLLFCLRTLLAPPDSRAPQLFHQKAWAQEKEQNTVLSGWVLSQHKWILQTGFSKNFPKIFTRRASQAFSWVEPYPQFFSTFAKLSKRAGRIFNFSEREKNAFMQAQILRFLDRILERFNSKNPTNEQSFSLSKQEEARIAHWATLQRAIQQKGKSLQVAELEVLEDQPFSGTSSQQKKWIQNLQFRLTGALGTKERALLESLRAGTDKDLTIAFHRLSQVALRLRKKLESQLQAQKDPLGVQKPDSSSINEIIHDLETLFQFQGLNIEPWGLPTSLPFRLAFDSSTGTSVFCRMEKPQILYVLLPLNGKKHIFTGYFLPFREVQSQNPIRNIREHK